MKRYAIILPLFVVFLLCMAAAVAKMQLKNAYLVTPLDGNNKAITNLSSLSTTGMITAAFMTNVIWIVDDSSGDRTLMDSSVDLAGTDLLGYELADDMLVAGRGLKTPRLNSGELRLGLSATTLATAALHGSNGLAQTEVIRFDSTGKTGALVVAASGVVSLSSNLIAAGSATATSFLLSDTNVYEDIVFNLSDLNPPGGLDGPTASITSGRSSESCGPVFSANDAAVVVIQLPHVWSPGSTVLPHLHVQPQTTNAITSTWKIKYAIADIGGTFPVWTTVTNTITIPGLNQWEHYLLNVPTNGISMVGFAGPSTIIQLRFELMSTTVDPHVISFDVHYRYRGSPTVFIP